MVITGCFNHQKAAYFLVQIPQIATEPLSKTLSPTWLHGDYAVAAHCSQRDGLSTNFIGMYKLTMTKTSISLNMLLCFSFASSQLLLYSRIPAC